MSALGSPAADLVSRHWAGNGLHMADEPDGKTEFVARFWYRPKS